MNHSRTPLMDISNKDGTSSPVAAGGRRKSGRAVKAPEKFAPDAASEALPTSTKRKRGGTYVENDASDVDEEAEDSDDPQDSAGEEAGPRRKGKSTKKPAAKKPKVNGASSHGGAPAVRLPARPKRSKRVVIVDDAAEGLYASVFTSEDSIEDIIGKWLDQYQNDNAIAVADLVNLILKSAGCDLKVSVDDINDGDNADGRLKDIQDEYQAEGVPDYPLISKSKSNQGIRASLVEVFSKLIEAAHISGRMFEPESRLLEFLQCWVAPMTSSGSRPFRHTATLIATVLTTALCSVALKESKAQADTLRQLEAEKKKKSANRARLADFQKKIANIENRVASVMGQIKDFFDLVYVHRYRDIDAKIRVECIEGMGSWILTLPGEFLDGNYLRYMGWLLSDEVMLVRHEVLKQLEKIMRNTPNIQGMHTFIERFRERIVEMATSDADPVVRASAVSVIDLIREKGLLEPDDIDTVGKLIFDSEPRVRRALVNFFSENLNDSFEAKIEELGGQETVDEYLVLEDEDNYDVPRTAWIRLKALTEILESYDLDDQEELPSQIDPGNFLSVSVSESRFTLAAQVLYEKVPDLKDWEILAGYLLFDHSQESSGDDAARALQESFKPSDREELILLEILNAVVKISLTHTDDFDKGKKKSARYETSENTARSLAGLMPRLLKKYGADPKTATVALRMEHGLNLGVFTELRQDATAYAKLLDEISTQFSAHSDRDVLVEACACFIHALQYEELEEVTLYKMQSLWENTTSTLQKLSQTGQMAVRNSLRNRPLIDLSNTLTRLELLCSATTCIEPFESSQTESAPLPILILLDIVARGIYVDSEDQARDDLEDKVVISAIKSLMFYFMWKVKDLESRAAIDDEIPDIEVDQLKEWQDIFITNLVAAFSSRDSPDGVRLLGAGTVLDVFALFSTLRHLVKPKDDDAEHGYAYLQTLIGEIGPEVKTEITSFFISLEKEHSKKSKKKLEDPADDEDPEDVDEESDDEDNENETEHKRLSEALAAEKELCEFTGKIVLAILSLAIDATDSEAGKLRKRIQRNRAHFGPNFKGIVAYLDEAKPKKTSHKSKAQQAAAEAKKNAKSKETVVEDEEDEDPFAEEVEPEEGTAEDLRRRELVDDEDEDEELPDDAKANDNDAVEPDPGDDDDVMGD